MNDGDPMEKVEWREGQLRQLSEQMGWSPADITATIRDALLDGWWKLRWLNHHLHPDRWDGGENAEDECGMLLIAEALYEYGNVNE